jgi:hypothetical protein
MRSLCRQQIWVCGRRYIFGAVAVFIRSFEKLYPDIPIEMIYTDLPRNDFSQVFRVIHGQTEIRSYYNEINNLYVTASRTSFHQAILPPNTLNLQLSATASHYLSASQCHITNPVHMVGTIGEVCTAFEEQSPKTEEICCCTGSKN